MKCVLIVLFPFITASLTHHNNNNDFNDSNHKNPNELSAKFNNNVSLYQIINIVSDNHTINNYELASGLANVCGNDIRVYNCTNDTNDHILLCLGHALNKNHPVSDDCRSEMLVHRRYMIENYNLTSDLVDACHSDIKTFCDRLESGSKTVHCLMSNARPLRTTGAKNIQISEKCRREIETLVKIVNIGEDWRADPILLESCQTPVDKYCHWIKPGNGRVLFCLLNHIDSDHTSEHCRHALMDIHYFVSRDFYLNSYLYEYCHKNVEEFCDAKPNWHNFNDTESGRKVLSCLYRYAFDPKENQKISGMCWLDIRHVLKRQAISVELMPDIEDACIDDLVQHCNNNIKPGYEIQCLQERYEYLDGKCQKAIFNFTLLESQRWELNYPLFKACHAANHDRDLCPDSHWRQLMDCVLQSKNRPAVKKHPKCREAIELFQVISLKDFRFNYEFKRVCESDVSAYCDSVRTKFEVVECLSSIVYNDTIANKPDSRISLECRKQLRVELLQRSESIKLDPVLENACEIDISEQCANVSAGEARVIECLKSNFKELRHECQRILFARERIEMSDNSVDYSLITDCRRTIAKNCFEESKDVLYCLRDCLLGSKIEFMDPNCRSIVIKRIAKQNTDYRLNPRLHSSCRSDITKFCGQSLMNSKPGTVLMNGEVISCLNKQYVLNSLSMLCEIEVKNIMREMFGNVELVPYNACQNEIKQKCANESNGVECVLRQFQYKQIECGDCNALVARFITDRMRSELMLYNLCSRERKHHCEDIALEDVKQLSCLLAAYQSFSNFTEQCSTWIDMYENAVLVAPIKNFGQLAEPAINYRNYFLLGLFSFVGLISAGGLLSYVLYRRRKSGYMYIRYI